MRDVQADQVAAVVAALRGGGVVVLPTDTVYGLLALPGDPVAADRLFELKGRGDDTPVAVLCADVDQALALADPADAVPGGGLRSVAERWWPGPLTLVARRRAGIVLHLGEPSTTVGLRVPDHPLVRAVAAEVGPIAATSANRHGEPTATTAAAAAASLGSGLALVVDGGELTGAASTVIDTTVEPWQVLRAGDLPISDILAAGTRPAGS
ncbi:MAG: L-threonylcarbamoyladenylate synthase [Acidimicrobiales bacterium]